MQEIPQNISTEQINPLISRLRDVTYVFNSKETRDENKVNTIIKT